MINRIIRLTLQTGLLTLAFALGEVLYFALAPVSFTHFLSFVFLITFRMRIFSNHVAVYELSEPSAQRQILHRVIDFMNIIHQKIEILIPKQKAHVLQKIRRCV